MSETEVPTTPGEPVPAEPVEVPEPVEDPAPVETPEPAEAPEEDDGA